MVPDETLRRYTNIMRLLHKIRYVLFFDESLTRDDRRMLENYKNTLEPERQALYKAIETDHDYLHSYSDFVKRRNAL